MEVEKVLGPLDQSAMLKEVVDAVNLIRIRTNKLETRADESKERTQDLERHSRKNCLRIWGGKVPKSATRFEEGAATCAERRSHSSGTLWSQTTRVSRV